MQLQTLPHYLLPYFSLFFVRHPEANKNSAFDIVSQSYLQMQGRVTQCPSEIGRAHV
jgi:hypothetical protein